MRRVFGKCFAGWSLGSVVGLDPEECCSPPLPQSYSERGRSRRQQRPKPRPLKPNPKPVRSWVFPKVEGATKSHEPFINPINRQYEPLQSP